MGRHFRAIKLAVLWAALMVLPGSGIAYAGDTTTTPGWTATPQVPEKPGARGTNTERYDILRALTREIAFVKTLSVDSPSQYYQSGTAAGAGPARHPVIAGPVNLSPRENPTFEDVKQVKGKEEQENKVRRKGTGTVGILMAILLGVSLTGCAAPEIRAIPEEIIKNEELKSAYEKGREDGRADAATLSRQQIEEHLGGFVRKYRDELLYLELVKGGVLKPARVSMVYLPGRVSDDGASFSAPSLSWKVVAPPQFISDESTKWLNKDRANFCYFLIKTFSTEMDATSFVGGSDKPGGVFLSMVPHGDAPGKFAVIGKTLTGNCENAMTFYRKKGHTAVQIE